jgi:hypothetical protein
MIGMIVAWNMFPKAFIPVFQRAMRFIYEGT